MKQIIIKFWPVLFIVGLWLVFCAPFLIKGQVPFPSDYLVNNFAPWSAYPEYAGPVKNAAQPDVITQIFPWKQLVIESWKQGNVPLWNNYSFAGTPLLANYQSAALSPINLLYFVLPFIDAWSLQILLQPLLAGLFMYMYVRAIRDVGGVRVSQEGALMSSVAFMFCGFITGWLSYGTLGYAILFLPLALFAIEKYYESKKWYYYVLLSLTIPLSFFSGHFQMSIYYLLFITYYLLFKAFTVRDINRTIPLFASIGLGLLLCAPQLLPSIELYLQSVRSSTFISTEVIPWNYLSTFVAPDFFGNPSTLNNWFGHYAEWGAYIGLIPFMLALYSVKKRTKISLFFLVAGLVALLLALDTPIQNLLVALQIPVLSTSAASRIIVLFSFSFAILAGFGLDKLTNDLKEKKVKEIFILLFGFLGVFGLLWGIVIFKLYLPEDKAIIAFSNLRLPTVMFVSFAAIIVGTLFLKNKKTLLILPFLLILITSFDVYRFATKWQTFGARNLVYPEVSVAKYIKSLGGKDRGLANFGGEAAMTLKLGSVEGYDPLYIGRYGEFLESSRDGLFHKAPRSAIALDKNGEFTPQVINLLGIKYFVQKVADENQPWGFPIQNHPIDQFSIKYQDSSYKVFENVHAFPKAFLVGNYQVISDSRKIIKELFSDDIKLDETVILEEDPGVTVEPDSSASAIFNKFDPNTIDIQINSSKPQMLFLSVPYSSEWNVAVDGYPAKIYRADYAFQAVPVKAGIHLVTFTYAADSFKIGVDIAVLGVVGMLGMLGFMRIKK